MNLTADERQQALYRQILGLKPSKGERRKITIIQAVIEGLSEAGFESVTFEGIGKRAKMRASHVAYYFPDLDDAVGSAVKFIVATAQQTTIERVKEGTNSRDKLNEFIEGTFAWAERYPDQFSVLLVLYFLSTNKNHKKYLKFHHQVRELGAQRLFAIIAPIVAKKKRKGGLGAMVIAKTVQSLLTGHLVDYFATETKRSLTDYKREVLQIVGQLI